MFIRVNFHDNDFATHVMSACEHIMHELSKGYKGEEAIKLYKEARDEYGMEAIRKSIVLSAYGYYIADHGARSYWQRLENVYDLTGKENILTYLDEEISVEEIQNFNQEWENSEVCYIDFYSMVVHLQ